MLSNIKCLNKELPRVKDLLKTIPNEAILTSIINKLGDYATDNDIIDYYNNIGNKKGEINYQIPSDRNVEEFVASEKTLRDLAARMSERIGIPVRFESDRSLKYKGKLEKGVAVINLAYATLDTPIHEILGHPIIRAIKNPTSSLRNHQSAISDYKDAFISEEMGEFMIKNKKGEYWGNYNTLEEAQKELDILQKATSKETSQLYQNLLKELEYGKGKEIFDRIRNDYEIKDIEYESVIDNPLPDVNKHGVFITDVIKPLIEDGYSRDAIVSILLRDFNEIDHENLFFNYQGWEPEFFGDERPDPKTTITEVLNVVQGVKFNTPKITYYSFEEHQEEAIVELLGLMTAEKLDNVKDGKLISLLKRLLKEMKQFVRSLLNQREVEIDKLPDNMSLGDIADVLAYSNSKIILPGNEVIYTTPDNKRFKSYAEASKHISNLAKNVKDIDLNSINLNVRLSEKDLKEIERLEKQKQEKENYFISTEYQQDKKDKLQSLNKKLEALKNKKVDFYSQEPSLDKEDIDKYGFQDYSYVRVESSYSRIKIFDKPLWEQEFGSDFKGYYIHGYNTDKTKPNRKVLKITKEEAERIWKKEVLKFPESALEIGDQQDLYRLQDEIKNVESDSKIKYEIDFIEKNIKVIKNGGNTIQNFIEKNKEYEQAKEIIEEWKRVNNIQYNPEEIYSRGQEFVSVVGAYSRFDVNLMMQNLLSHIEDNEKAGGKFAISAFTKPVDKKIGHLEGGGGKIKFKIYPQSNDILWAANSDVFSGSVWDASEKVNKDKKSELLGVSYTKYPSLQNINYVQPNLANIVDDLQHHHNELGIILTGNNFRLEYDEDIPHTTKNIINNINKILDQKYGKLIKPTVQNSNGVIYKVLDFDGNMVRMFDTKVEADTYINNNPYYAVVEAKKGIKPNQDYENLKETIDDIKDNIISSKASNWRLIPGPGGENMNWAVEYFLTDEFTGEFEFFDTEKEANDFINSLFNIKEKEYNSQALINTKIAALKEVAKKYPRALIRSEVKSINSEINFLSNSETFFQKATETPKDEVESAMESILARYGVTVERMDKVLHDGKSVIALADIANRIVKVSRGADKLTLPEETGHFILELLGDNSPLLQRIVELARKTQVYKDIYDDYMEAYNGNEYEVAKEAAAKILKRSLASAIENPTNEEKSIWKQLKATIDLIWKKVQQIFKTLKDDELSDLLDKVAIGVVNNNSDITSQLSWDNVSDDSKNVSKAQLEVDRIRKLVEKLKSSLIQKLAIYRKRAIDTQEKVDYQLRINDALERLKSVESVEAISIFIETATKDLELVDKRLVDLLKNRDKLNISSLEQLYQYTSSYGILDEIQKIYTTDETLLEIQKFIRAELLPVYNRVKDTYVHEGAKLLADFYHKTSVTKEMNLTKDDIELMLLESVGDIGKFTSYVQSVGETDADTLVGLVGKAIRYAKSDVMLNTNVYKKKLVDFIEKYEKELGKSGNELWDTIMQYNTKGELTGRYVEKLGSKFWETREQFKKELEKENLSKAERIEIIRKYIDFDAIKDDVLKGAILTYPDEGVLGTWHYQNANNPIYFDKKFMNLTAKEKEFLDGYILLLDELRKQLPNNRVYRNLLPQVQSGFIETLKRSPKEKRAQLIKDHFSLIEKSDGKNTTLFRQDGSEAKFVPLHYTGRLSNPNTIEKDLGASTLMFAEMAYNNKLMHQLEEVMQMTLNVVGEREVTPTKFGKPLKPAIEGMVTQPIKGFQTNTYNLLKEYIEMQVYGETEKEELLGKFNIGKAANMVNAYTAVKGLAGNLFSSVSNVTVGRFMRLMEAVANENFNLSDWKWGNKTFFTELIPALSDLTARQPRTKFGMFIETLDIVQGFEDAIKASESKLSQKTFKRNMKLSHIFILNNLGEFMLQVTTAMAYGRNYTLESGKVVNMYESAYVDKNGNLRFKNGVTGKDLKNFIDRARGLNESLDGIYGKVDKSLAQRYAVGRLAFLFRRFMVPTFSKRWKNFSGPKFNVKRNKMEEGFYISLFKFLGGVLKEMKISGISLASAKSTWSKTEEFRKANVKRAATELIMLIALALVTKMMEGEFDDDDEPALAFTFYQLNRMYVELGAFAPPIGITEAFKLAKSPAAGVNTLQDLTRLTFDLFHPWDRYEGGSHEGDLKIYWHTIKMIPIVNQYQKLQEIDEQTKGIQALF